jgi:hypothetical protein
MPGTSRLAKVARITAKIALGLVTIAIVIVLISGIVNFFDAPLSEQAKALLSPPPNPYPGDENLYLAMAGLEGTGQRSIIEIGQERIAAYNQTLDSMRFDSEAAFELNKKWDAGKLAFNGKQEWGSLRTTSIWEYAQSHRQDNAALLVSNQQLYQRYLSLHLLHGYYETIRPSFMAPFVVVPQPLRVLFLGHVANRLQTGAVEQQREALVDLQRDIQMWRTVLKGDGTLISKMVAAASLHGDMILTADLIADPNTDLSSVDDVLAPLVLPFDLKDYRIGSAFGAEFRGTAALYKTVAAENAPADSKSLSWEERTSNVFQAHFFKLNATENMSAARAVRWAALADSEASQFDRNRDANRTWFKDNDLHFSVGFLYNPIGKILVAIATPQNDKYSLRIYDVAAFQRLVYLAYQLKRQHITAADVPAFLEAHPEWSTHPVDGKPFRCNADTGELAMTTLGEHPAGQRFSATYFRSRT